MEGREDEEWKESVRERQSEWERETQRKKITREVYIHIASAVSLPSHLVPPHKQLGVRVLEEASNVCPYKR